MTARDTIHASAASATRMLAELAIHTRRLAWCAVGPGATLVEDTLEATSHRCMDLADSLAGWLERKPNAEITTVARVRLFEGRLTYPGTVVLEVAATRLATVAGLLRNSPARNSPLGAALGEASTALAEEVGSVRRCQRELDSIEQGGLVSPRWRDTMTV